MTANTSHQNHSTNDHSAAEAPPQPTLRELMRRHRQRQESAPPPAVAEALEERRLYTTASVSGGLYRRWNFRLRYL